MPLTIRQEASIGPACGAGRCRKNATASKRHAGAKTRHTCPHLHSTSWSRSSLSSSNRPFIVHVYGMEGKPCFSASVSPSSSLLVAAFLLNAKGYNKIKQSLETHFVVFRMAFPAPPFIISPIDATACSSDLIIVLSRHLAH